MSAPSRSKNQNGGEEPFDPGHDSFIKSLVCRKVCQLIDRYGFSPSDRDDLKQEMFARVVKGLERFNPDVGHRNPFVKAIVERHFSNILRSRNAEKRNGAKTGSLNVNIQSMDGGPTELIQTIGEDDVDRRLGRERILSDEQLNDLRHDMCQVISRLPQHLQRFLDLRKTRNLKEISIDMSVPRSTLTSWVDEIRRHFEDAGLETYFHE